MSGDVLIIEADDDVAGQIADAVGQRGLSPRVTNDGKNGYDLAQAEKPAAIVLCAELPKVSGYSICAKLKKDPTLKDVPLIFTSSEASESTFEHHKKLKVRADEYLSKPFAMPQLLDLLARHVALTPGDSGVAVADEISISEDIAIEAEPELIEEEPTFAVDANSGTGGFSSTDVAFDAALEAISEQPEVQPAPVASPTPRAAVDASMAPTSPPAPSNGSSIEARSGSLRTGDLERMSGSAGGSQRALLELKKELNAKDRELFELRDQIHAKDRDLLSLRDRETELEGRVVQADEEREALEARLREAESRCDALQAEQADAERRARDAEQRAHTLQSELEQASSERQSVESARASAEAEAEHLRSELDAARREAEEAKGAREAAESQREQLERRARDAEDAAGKAKTALESGLEILRQIDPSSS